VFAIFLDSKPQATIIVGLDLTWRLETFGMCSQLSTKLTVQHTF
jgi:hypothetical protein